MTIQQTLSQLNSITSRYANTAYDETTFHKHFSKTLPGASSDPAGRAFEDIEYALDVLIYEIQLNQDRFMHYDYDNFNEKKLYASNISEAESFDKFRKIFDSSINHLKALVSLPILQELSGYENEYISLKSIREKSYEIMNSFYFDSVFESKVKMISRNIEYSMNQPKERAFLISKIKKLASEFPEIDDNHVRSLFNDFKDEYFDIVEKCKAAVNLNNPNEFNCMADKFISALNLSETPIKQFLVNKQQGVEISNEISFTKSQSIQSMYIFKDDSIVIKESDGSYSKVMGAIALRKLNIQAHVDGIDYMLRKRPQVNKFFKSKFLEERSFNSAINSVISFVDNEVILKNKKVDLTLLKDKSFEGIDDYINSVKKIHQVEQFAGSILSSKYKHLLNDNTFKYFETLHEQNFSQQELQMYIGKKLASIKSEDAMINVLQGTINLFSGFTPSKVIEKLDDLGITPIINDGHILTFEVTTYDQCKKIGSPSWCIVRDSSYFDYYTSEDNKQYICYDFSKDQSNRQSMLGFTYTNEGTIKASHYKNDDDLDTKRNPDIEKIFNKTLYLNRKKHFLDDDILDRLDKEYGYEKVKNNKGMKIS